MRAIFCFALLAALSVPAFPQQVIINELYNSSSTDEWIELVVVTDGLDLRGWDLRDFSSGGTAQDPLEFLPVPLWSNLEAGTVIIAAKPDSLAPEDLDPSDFLIRVNTNNTNFFDGPLFVFAGSSDAIQIRDSSDLHVFGLSWGTGNAGSLPEPRVHFDEASASNTAAAFAGDSPAQATSTDFWLWDNPGPTPGIGNSAGNSAWIDSLRAITAYADAEPALTPMGTELLQNYPNPFNPRTIIGLQVADYGHVLLKVFDVRGLEVATLVNQELVPGSYAVGWDASGLTSGVYFSRLEVRGTAFTRKMLYLR